MTRCREFSLQSQSVLNSRVSVSFALMLMDVGKLVMCLVSPA